MRPLVSIPRRLGDRPPCSSCRLLTQRSPDPHHPSAGRKLLVEMGQAMVLDVQEAILAAQAVATSTSSDSPAASGASISTSAASFAASAASADAPASASTVEASAPSEASAASGSQVCAESVSWLEAELAASTLLGRPAEHFNHDENLLAALKQVVEAKGLALVRGLRLMGMPTDRLLAVTGATLSARRRGMVLR